MIKGVSMSTTLVLAALAMIVFFVGYRRCTSMRNNFQAPSAEITGYKPPMDTTSDFSGLYGDLARPKAESDHAVDESVASTPVAPPVATKKPKPTPKPAPSEFPVIYTAPSSAPVVNAAAAKDEFTSKGVEPPKPATNVGSRLYITVKNTKLRSSPGLDGKVLGKLPLFTEVYYLNEVTPYKQQINLGKEVANEPWVRVRTARGTEGWVYGAFVNYYREKRSGTWQ
jgi:hypothetical protein